MKKTLATAGLLLATACAPTDVIETLAPGYFRRAVQISAVGLATWAGGPQ
jgi:hypothetical protein